MTVQVMRILLVDDDHAQIELLTQYLAVHAPRMEVDAVSTCREYLDKLKSRPFDLVLADYDLPDTSGNELLEQAREWASDVPVVFVVDENDENSARQSEHPNLSLIHI